MQITKAGLRRRLIALVRVRGASRVVLPERGKLIVKMPDRVGKAPLLRDEQQQRAGEMQERASHRWSD